MIEAFEALLGKLLGNSDRASRLALPVLVALLVLVLGMVIASVLPKNYKSVATIEIVEPKNLGSMVSTAGRDDFSSLQFYGTLSEKVRGDRVISSALKDLSRSELSPSAKSMARLRKSISVKRRGASRLFDVVCIGKSKVSAGKGANAVADAFIESWKIENQNRYRNLRDSIATKLARQQKIIADSKSLIQESAGASVDEITRYRKAIALAENEIRLSEARLKKAEEDTAVLNQVTRVEKAAIPALAKQTPGLAVSVLVVCMLSFISGALAYVWQKFRGRRRGSLEKLRSSLTSAEVVVAPEFSFKNRTEFEATYQSECYQVLVNRLNKLKSASSKQCLVIGVTACEQGDGGTFTSMNLAKNLAQAGRPVLLVEFDLQTSYLKRLYDLNVQGGVSDYLTGQVALKDAVSKMGGSNLWLMPGGSRVDDPVELIRSRQTEELLQQLKSRFEVIILDIPPILSGASALLLVAEAHHTLVVGSATSLSNKVLSRVEQAVDKSGSEFTGVILNKVSSNQGPKGNTPKKTASAQ